MAEIKNREESEAWLRKQPREVAVAFAARAALRVLPVLGLGRGRSSRGDFIADIMLRVFRATGVAWAAAKYPAQATKLRNAYASAYANASAYAASAAAVPASAYASGYASAYASAYSSSYASAFKAANAADRAYASAFASTYADAADAAYSAYASAAYAARASAASDSPSATSAARAAGAALWSAFSADATRVEEGASASVIAGSPLWPQHQFGSEPLRSLWEEMKQTLHAAEQDWDVWTNWYEDRLYGRPRADKWELAYVRIEDEIWKQGPAIVNAEIKRRIEADIEPDLRGQVVADASNVAANPVSRVGATRTRPESRRLVFKGFFSYTHRDAEVDPYIVEAFSSELEKRVDAKLVNARFEIWRDKEKLRVGDYWNQRIEGAIDTSHIFIVVLTPKWISSDYCRKEFEAFEKIEAARNSGGYVIPIYARDIERQARFLEPEQKQLLDRLKRIQFQQVIPKQFARLSDHERIDLIEGVADPICDMLDRLRDKQET